MMSPSLSRHLRESAFPLLIVFGVAGLFLLVLATGSVRALASALFVVLGVVVAFGSGNPRLFALWGLMITISLNLSKHFGPIVNKGGGETSFRAEVSDPFLIVLAAFLLRDLWQARMKGLQIPRVTYLWLAIMAMGIATIVAGPWRTTAAHEVVRMLKMTLLFIVVTNELRTPGRMLHCLGGLVAGMLGQSVIGILQYARGANLGLEILGETSSKTIEVLAQNSLQSQKVWRVSGLLLHPNLFGIYLATLIPIAAGAFLLHVGRMSRAFFLAAAGAGTVALIFTFSRSSWASFAAAGVVLAAVAIRHRNLRGRSMRAGLVAALTVVVIGIAFSGQIATRLFESREDATLGRAQFEKDAMRMIWVKPWLGWGVNSYVHEVVPFLEHPVKAYSGWVPPVHNIYLLWWAETGIVGLIIHLWMWAAIGWTALQNLKVRDEVMYVANAAALAGLIAFAVDGFLSFSLRINQPQRVFWVLAAVIMAVRYWRLRQPAPALQPGKQDG